MRVDAFGQSRRVLTSSTETWWLVPARIRQRPTLCLLMSDTRGGGGAACGPKNIFLGESSSSTHGHQIGEAELSAVLTTRFRALKVTLTNGHTLILTPNRNGAIAFKHRLGVRRAVPIPVSVR